jgi:predicted transcriptional regulator
MKYGNRTDITAQILEVAATGLVTKSMIMYKAFLSSNHLKEYLAALMEKELIKYLSAENKYMKTRDDVKVLRMLEELSRFISS